MPSKVILALDQSTRISGWSLFVGTTLKSFGKWEYDDNDLAVRINSLCQQIEQQIDEFKPDIIVIENIQFEQRHGIDTFQKLAQVQGAIMRLCVQKKVKYKLTYPTAWRANCNFLKGQAKDRNSQKKIAQSWVQSTYGMKCTQDEADAICIGYSEALEQDQFFDWTE